jgi:hypothetical protein
MPAHGSAFQAFGLSLGNQRTRSSASLRASPGSSRAASSAMNKFRSRIARRCCSLRLRPPVLEPNRTSSNSRFRLLSSQNEADAGSGSSEATAEPRKRSAAPPRFEGRDPLVPSREEAARRALGTLLRWREHGASKRNRTPRRRLAAACKHEPRELFGGPLFSGLQPVHRDAQPRRQSSQRLNAWPARVRFEPADIGVGDALGRQLALRKP